MSVWSSFHRFSIFYFDYIDILIFYLCDHLFIDIVQLHHRTLIFNFPESFFESLDFLKIRSGRSFLDRVRLQVIWWFIRFQKKSPALWHRTRMLQQRNLFHHLMLNQNCSPAEFLSVLQCRVRVGSRCLAACSPPTHRVCNNGHWYFDLLQC